MSQQAWQLSRHQERQCKGTAGCCQEAGGLDHEKYVPLTHVWHGGQAERERTTMHTRVLFASGPVSSLHQCRAPSAFPCSFRALPPSSECTSTGSNLEDFLPLQFQGVSSCQAAEWRNRGAGAWRRAAETVVDVAQLVGAQRLQLLSLDIDGLTQNNLPRLDWTRLAQTLQSVLRVSQELDTLQKEARAQQLQDS